MSSEPPGDAADEDERRLHPAYVIARVASTLRNLIPAILALAIGGDWGHWVIAGLVIAVPTVMVLEWRATRYAVVDGALRLRSGLINRSERVIPASRISALDTSRGLVQRLFGLVSLEVQTAGGGKKAELRLDAVRFAEAERLRRLLGHAGAETGDAPGVLADVFVRERRPDGDPEGAAEPDGPPSSPDPVYAITPRALLVAALTGPQLGLAAVAVASAGSQLGDVLPHGAAGWIDDSVSSATAATAVLLLLGALAIVVVASALGTALAFSGFRVVRDDRRLRVRRGLLTERTGTIALDRVHGVRIVEGLLRRPLGYATVQVEVAGYRGEGDVTRTLIPLVHRRDLPALMARVLPEVPWPAGPLRRPPARARRRFSTVPLLAAVVPALAAAVLLPDTWRTLAAAPVLIAVLLGEARWRGAGWRLDAGSLTLRRQLLARTTLLALPRRVQRVRLRTTPFSRRAELATFSVVLATGRRGTAALLDAATADDLQRAVAARTTRRPRAAARDDLPLDFAAAPPE
jgi:putative membrane protein